MRRTNAGSSFGAEEIRECEASEAERPQLKELAAWQCVRLRTGHGMHRQ